MTRRKVFPSLPFNNPQHSRTEFVTITNQDLGTRILKSQSWQPETFQGVEENPRELSWCDEDAVSSAFLPHDRFVLFFLPDCAC